jgi:hypothetical protein
MRSLIVFVVFCCFSFNYFDSSAINRVFPGDPPPGTQLSVYTCFNKLTIDKKCLSVSASSLTLDIGVSLPCFAQPCSGTPKINRILGARLLRIPTTSQPINPNLSIPPSTYADMTIPLTFDPSVQSTVTDTLSILNTSFNSQGGVPVFNNIPTLSTLWIDDDPNKQIFLIALDLYVEHTCICQHPGIHNYARTAYIHLWNGNSSDRGISYSFINLTGAHVAEEPALQATGKISFLHGGGQPNSNSTGWHPERLISNTINGNTSGLIEFPYPEIIGAFILWGEQPTEPPQEGQPDEIDVVVAAPGPYEANWQGRAIVTDRAGSSEASASAKGFVMLTRAFWKWDPQTNTWLKGVGFGDPWFQ